MNRTEEPADLLVATATGSWPEVLPPRGRDTTAVDGVRWLIGQQAGEPEKLGASFGAALQRLWDEGEDEAVKRLASGLVEAHEVKGNEMISRAIARVIGSAEDPAVVAGLAEAWIEHGSLDRILQLLTCCPLPPADRAALALVAIRRRAPEALLDRISSWSSAARLRDLELTFALWLAKDASREMELRRYLVAPGHEDRQLRDAARRALRAAGGIGWAGADSEPEPFRRFGDGRLEAA